MIRACTGMHFTSEYRKSFVFWKVAYIKVVMNHVSGSVVKGYLKYAKPELSRVFAFLGDVVY